MASSKDPPRPNDSPSSPLSFKMKVTRSGGVCSKTGGTSDPYSPGYGDSEDELDPHAFSDVEGDSVPGRSNAGAPPPPPDLTSPQAPSGVGCSPFDRGAVNDGEDDVDSAIGCFGQISKRQSNSTSAISAKSESTASGSKLSKTTNRSSEQPIVAPTASPSPDPITTSDNNNTIPPTTPPPPKNIVAPSSAEDDLLVQASLRALNVDASQSLSLKTKSDETVAMSSSDATTKVVEAVSGSFEKTTTSQQTATTSSTSSSSAFKSTASAEESSAVATTRESISSSKVESSIKECKSAKIEKQSSSSSSSSTFMTSSAESRATKTAEATKTSTSLEAVSQTTSTAKSFQQSAVTSSSTSSSSSSSTSRVIKASGTLRQASTGIDTLLVPGAQLNLMGTNRGSPLKITLNSRCISEDGEGDDSFDALVEKYSTTIKIGVTVLRDGSYKEQRRALSDMHKAMRSAWATPLHGRDVAMVLCELLRDSGGLDILISKVDDKRKDMRLDSARVIEQSLTANNRDFVVKEGLNPVVNFSITRGDVQVSRIGTGILGNLFKHSEDACHRVIKLGGLDSIVDRCITSDKETNRQCAIAFANLAMYGGVENQQRMIKKQVPAWLFPLAFSTDDITKYYACLAICTLASNKEFAATVEQSGTLALVEPFITQHDPGEFAASDGVHQHGQSEGWLRRLLPLLDSTNKEAQSLASFHFAMEATIKSKSSKHEVLKNIGAIAALQKVASCPNDTASKLAAKALSTLGEDIPHHLSQQVPLWTVNDVFTWVDRVLEFPEYAQAFLACRIDGDLLLQITEDQLRDDVGMINGIHRKRFVRCLNKLKQECDYSSCDHTKIDNWLMKVGAMMTQYTYDFCRNGVHQSELNLLEDVHLHRDIGISNGFHRKLILRAIQERESSMLADEAGDSESGQRFVKNIDVFISYRRSNGSQLASLLKVHLQLRGFTVFIDIEKLEAGKFDENLLNSVRAAKHFLLVLTPKALDRCIGDDEQNDWVHKEIATALQSDCNIIPITDDFEWPQPESLPEDIRKVCYYNGVRWIHDYQDACVEKIVRFLRGEIGASSASQYSRLNSTLGAASLPGSGASGSDYQPSSLREAGRRWRSIESTDGTLAEESPEAEIKPVASDEVDAAAPLAKGEEEEEEEDEEETEADEKDGKENFEDGKRGVADDEDENAQDDGSIRQNGPYEPLDIKENGWERGDASPNPSFEDRDPGFNEDVKSISPAPDPTPDPPPVSPPSPPSVFPPEPLTDGASKIPSAPATPLPETSRSAPPRPVKINGEAREDFESSSSDLEENDVVIASTPENVVKNPRGDAVESQA